MSHMAMNMTHIEMYMPRAVRDNKIILSAENLALFGEMAYGVLDYGIYNGVAIIDINGAIASARIPYWFCYADLTYESIVETIAHAIHSPDVSAVILRFNSPGGTVLGCAEAANEIDKMSNGDKPIISHATMADSAAYWLASSTNRIVLDPTGEVGSIGVICSHVDYSEFYKKWGIVVTDIYSGDHKADGSPNKPLSKESKDRIQADIDYLRELFVEAVSTFRGMDMNQVMDTEAKTYIGRQAIDIGLADDVSFFNELLHGLPDLVTV